MGQAIAPAGAWPVPVSVLILPLLPVSTFFYRKKKGRVRSEGEEDETGKKCEIYKVIMTN